MSRVDALRREIHEYLIRLPAWDADRVRELMRELEREIRKEYIAQYTPRVTSHTFEDGNGDLCTASLFGNICGELRRYHDLVDDDTDPDEIVGVPV
jgi:hypothetical protein